LVGWTAPLTDIPGAKWIWASQQLAKQPDGTEKPVPITGATSPAANAVFTFQTGFYLCGEPTEGTIWVAADNSAEVFLNGKPVTTDASGQSVPTNTDHTKLTKVENVLPSSGLNIIQVKVTNGANPADCGSDQYKCNPAGMVFGATFKDALPDWPTCPGRPPPHKPIKVGGTEPLQCPAGQTGGIERCICLTANLTTWITETACRPFQCTDTGKSYNVGDRRPRNCPPGRPGSASQKCISEETWGPIDYSACVALTPVPRPFCIGLGGTVYLAGRTETLPCTTPPLIAGSLTHKCLASGQWGPTSGTCMLPTVCAGCQCGSVDGNPQITGLCPTGTSCAARRIDRELVTADWYCDPP